MDFLRKKLAEVDGEMARSSGAAAASSAPPTPQPALSEPQSPADVYVPQAADPAMERKMSELVDRAKTANKQLDGWRARAERSESALAGMREHAAAADEKVEKLKGLLTRLKGAKQDAEAKVEAAQAKAEEADARAKLAEAAAAEAQATAAEAQVAVAAAGGSDHAPSAATEVHVSESAVAAAAVDASTATVARGQSRAGT